MAEPDAHVPAWATDAAGRRVLAGLSAEETDEYFSLLHAEPDLSCQEMQERHRLLHRKHQLAIQGRVGGPMKPPPPARTCSTPKT